MTALAITKKDTEELLNRLQPFDVVFSKNQLKEFIEAYPDILDELTEMLNSNPEWFRKASASKDVYFIINNTSWKYPALASFHKPRLVLSVVGKTSVPTISFNIK